MNANELADKLDEYCGSLYFGGIKISEATTMLRAQQAEIEALKKEMWVTEVNVQQQTLAYIIKLLTVQHDTLACTSYPMSKENREAIKK